MNYADYLTNDDFIAWIKETYRSNFSLDNKITIYRMRKVDLVGTKIIAAKLGITKEHIYASIRTFELCVNRYVADKNGETYEHEMPGRLRAAWRDLTKADIDKLPTSYGTTERGGYYFTGKLCINGHKSLRIRQANTGQCVICQVNKARAWNKAKLVPLRDKKHKQPTGPTKTVTVFGMKIKVREKI
jgi:hypothetical protein